MTSAASDPLVFLVGPTAAGKTALALEAAERAGAEILSLDSMLVYRGLDVGTAKPDAAERARVPHHLLDLVDPPERFHLRRYVDAAEEALGRVRAAGRPALFVGGTGLYLKALTHGLFEGPVHDPELRDALNARAREEGSAVLHAELATIDPESAARIHPNDAKRIVRGLEVHRQTGRTLTQLQQEWEQPSAARPRTLVGLEVGVERLDERIAARTAAMLDAGWVEEAVAIRDGVGFGPTSSQALGYADVLRFADGELSRGEMEEAVRLATRRFARRQRTWFRGFPDITWVDGEKDPEHALGVLADALRGS